MTTCSECNGPLPVKTGFGRPFITCGPDCFRARNARRSAEKYLREKDTTPWYCVDCSTRIGSGATSRRSVKRCEPCGRKHRKTLADARYQRKKVKGAVTDPAVWRARMERDRADPTYARRKLDNRLRSVYGIGVDEFEAMAERQNGLCAICELAPVGRGKGDVLVVDHCHKQGHVRSLLCGNCNIAIGLMNDSPEIVVRAAEYLRYWSAREASI